MTKETLKDAFDRGHEEGRNEIFRQVQDVRASHKAHERKVREEFKQLPIGKKLGATDRRLKLFEIAVAQLKEIDEYINVLLPAVYKEGGGRE